MEADLIVNSRIRVPAAEFSWSFVRSSGPGGQNVNKVASKAVLRWNVRDSPSLPDAVRERFLSQYRRRVSAAGELILSSQRYRDQPRNIDDCREKLRNMLLAAATPPKTRKPTKISAAQKAKRLADKRRQSQRKESRRRPEMGD